MPRSVHNSDVELAKPLFHRKRRRSDTVISSSVGLQPFFNVGRRYSAGSSRLFSPFFSDHFERRGLVYVGASIQHKTASDAVFAEYGFTWDAGNRITEFETIDGTAEYTYDKTGQLTGADYDYITDELYTYDDNGNRTNSGYVTGENNETLSDGIYRYSYDNEGNRTEKFLWTDTNNDGIIDASEKTLVQTYEWDYRNRLSSVTNYENGIAKEVMDYLYDYLNLMIERTVTDAATSALQSSDFNIYSNGQVVLEYDTTSSVDVVKSINLWGANIDELVAVEQMAQSVNDNNVILWTYGDHLNSIRDVLIYDSIDKTAAVVNHLIYNAFGILVSSTDGNSNNPTSISPLLKYRYTGKYYDDLTGLQNNINRWYDNTTGKWISEDPISFDGGDSNLYRYLYNDSLIFLDYNGLSIWSDSLEYAKAFGEGLKTGGKAVVNGAAGAIVSTATLGFVSYDGPFTMNEKDIAYGGKTAQMFAQGGAEILIGVGTGGVASLASNSSKASTAVKIVAHSANVFDAAGNTLNATRGVYDMTQNGVTLQNTLQVGFGSFGVAGNSTPYYKMANEYYSFQPRYDNQAQIRQRVLSNIEESKKARLSSKMGEPLTTEPRVTQPTKESVLQLQEDRSLFLEEQQQYRLTHPNEVINPDRWPSHNGFERMFRFRYTLQPGEIITRVGKEGGNFASPVGTMPFEARALPPSYICKDFHSYKVVRPIRCEEGLAAPAFGQSGQGIQYMFYETIESLLKKGYIVEYP